MNTGVNNVGFMRISFDASKGYAGITGVTDDMAQQLLLCSALELVAMNGEQIVEVKMLYPITGYNPQVAERNFSCQSMAFDDVSGGYVLNIEMIQFSKQTKKFTQTIFTVA